jgi:MFS family permease
VKKLAFLIAAAAVFGVFPMAMRLGTVTGSLLLVVLGVSLAVAASEGIHALSVGAGAMGAFVGTILATVAPPVAGAALVGLAFAERTTRVRGRSARLVHMGGALLGGSLAGVLAYSYSTASLAVHLVAIVVAAVLVALPLLVEADDPIAHMLDEASSDVTGIARTRLYEGAELRRTADDVVLDADSAKRVKRTWSSLLRLAEARVRLEKTTRPSTTTSPGSAAAAVVDMVDQRIADHVTALTRAYTAVDAARAAAVGLDDADLKSVEHGAESLEDVSRALMEIES